MPKLVKYRKWCLNCNNWEIFFEKNLFDPKSLVCESCRLAYVEINLSEIPEDKIQLQRYRYKIMLKKNNDVVRFFALSLGLGFPSMPVQNIIEDDAGQREIYLQIQKQNEEIKEQKRVQRLEYEAEQQKYKHLGRNDRCSCGSGKKYKKCCLSKFS